MNHLRANYEFGDFILDVGQQRLLRRNTGERMPLIGKPFDTLVYLVEHAGEPLDKDTLLRALWPGVVVEENNLTQVISTLRQLLGETRGENSYIATLPRKGYRFVATVTECDGVHVPAQVDLVRAPPAAKSKRPTHGLWIGVATVLTMLLVVSIYFTRDTQPEADSQPLRTLAVLPFKPLLPSQSNAALELGMTDTLIAQLSQQGIEAVQPLSSVRKFDSINQDALAAGRELQVDAVLDGLLQRDDDQLRVSVRLLRVSDGKQLWIQSFDQPFTGIFGVQDAIAERVTEAFADNGLRASRSALRRYTQNSDAYSTFVAARFAHSRLTETSLRQAIDLYQQAIVLDRNYAHAYGKSANCYLMLGVIGAQAPLELHPHAAAAIEKALSLDPLLAAAYTERGHLKLLNGDWDGAANDIARAIELDPQYSFNYVHRGALYAMQGDHEKSQSYFKHAQLLEPGALVIPARAAQMQIFARRYDQAIIDLRRILSVDDGLEVARGFLVHALIARGNYDDALKELAGGKSAGPGSLSYSAQALALSGRHKESIAALNQLLADGQRRYVPPLDIAMAYAALKDTNKTLIWVERSLKDGAPGFLAQDSLFDFLHGDPRFDKLVKQNGIYGRTLPE